MLFGLKRFYLVLAGRAFFLLTAKETKLPARNFFIQVSRWARSLPSEKIDHAGLRAERRNGGSALLVVIATAILVINLSLHPNSPHAMATLLPGLGHDGRRKR